MAAPVVVSRIQNRRGTQAEFYSLYPVGYTGTGGYGSLPGFNSTNYPNVLAAGELALCTDSRSIYIGNLNAEYVKVGEITSLTGLNFEPVVFVLPPSGVFTTIPLPGISYSATPYFSITYSLSDAAIVDQNSVGVTFARNGELQITALASPYTSLTDVGTEINLTGYSITFQSIYSGSYIVVEYMHDFPTPLIFSTTTIHWIANAPPPPATYPTFDSIVDTFDSTVITFDEGP